MSPVSRGRKKKSKPARKPRDVLAQALHEFKSYGSLADPMLAEANAADLIDQLQAERLIEYAASKPNPVSLAFLRAVQALGLSDEARVAADRLAGRGVSEPVWADTIEQLTMGDCWEFADVYGDLVVVVVIFERAGAKHGLVISIDANKPSRNDTDIAQEPEALISELQARADQGLYTLRQVSGERARRRVEEYLAAPDLPSRTFAVARTRRMPEPEPAESPRVYTDAEREAIVTEFVTETQVEARETARLIVDFGCDRAGGRPLRVSPGKMIAFLEHLEQTDVDIDETVLPVWARWAAAKVELPEQAMEELLGMLETVTNQDVPIESYLDGVDSGASEDEIVETLARRRFAMPNHTAEILGEHFDYLDPADPDDRHLLLVGEHPEYQEALDDPSFEGTIDGVKPRVFIALREVLINQLWDDTPPEAWEAAKRMLDAGHDREEILRAVGFVLAPHITDALAGKPFDENVYRAELRTL